MQIIIRNQSDQPIYEQIKERIKELILSGELTSGEALPSIRNLARDLRISVITTKKAYEELEKDGYIEVIPSKGCYVKAKSNAFLKEEVLKKIEAHLDQALHIAQTYQIEKSEVLEILESLYEEDIYEK